MAAPTPGPGQNFGHFRLLEEIGEGGFGIVYRARDTSLERDVAVKILNARTLGDETARKRFRREALMLSRLNHPNIEAVYAFHAEQGLDYLVMEYVPGVMLNERLETGALPEKEVLELGIQLARGLAAAHAQRVIHRDLKPGNLKVTPDKLLKILDFGLAQLFSHPEDKTVSIEEAQTASQPYAGTPAYLPPEQAEGREPDTRSDIYSAGVVLYELATGVRPFPLRGEMLRDAILHAQPPPPRSKNKDISPGLEAVILKCLQKDPKLRYQSATELLDDLKELARGSGQQRAVGVPPKAGWSSKRRVVAAAVLVTAVSGVVLWRKLKGQPQPPHLSVIVAEFENRTGDPVFDQTPRELISTALGQSPQVSVFPSSRLPDVLRRMQKPETAAVDEKVAGEACMREGLQSVISGSISKLGSSYLALVRALNCNGDVIISTQKSFSGPEQLPPAIDEIVATIRHKWGESTGAIQKASQPLALVTSGSLEALKLYSSGKQQLYLGNFRGAASLFRKAVDLDNSFAMAHEYLALAYEHLGDDSHAGEEYARAAQLADRVTVREREKILGDYALFNYNSAEAIPHYQVLAELSPEDPAIHVNLAESYGLQFRFDLAISEAKKAVDLNPSPAPRNKLATYFFLSGDSKRAVELGSDILQDYPEDWEALYLIGSCYLAMGKPRDANGVWRTLLGLGGDAASKAWAAMADSALARDDIKAAMSYLENGLVVDAELGNAFELSRKKILLAETSQAVRDSQLLTNSLQKLQEPVAPDLVFLLGRLYARLGRVSDAQRELRALEQSADKTPRMTSFSYVLQSEIAAAQGRFPAAVQSAKLGAQHLNSPVAIEALAKAYQLVGDRESAIHQYETLLSRANERQFDSVDSPALHAVANARYRLGILYQALGRDDLAKEQFNALLIYASETEHTGPVFEDAKKRIAELKPKYALPAGQPPQRTGSTH